MRETKSVFFTLNSFVITRDVQDFNFQNLARAKLAGVISTNLARSGTELLHLI